MDHCSIRSDKIRDIVYEDNDIMMKSCQKFQLLIMVVMFLFINQEMKIIMEKVTQMKEMSWKK